MGTPSTIIRGWLAPEMVLCPRILIEVPAPASPLTALTITLEALAAKEFAINDSPERAISLAATGTLLDPC